MVVTEEIDSLSLAQREEGRDKRIGERRLVKRHKALVTPLALVNPDGCRRGGVKVMGYAFRVDKTRSTFKR